LVEQVRQAKEAVCGRTFAFCLLKVGPVYVHYRPAFCEPRDAGLLVALLGLAHAIVDVAHLPEPPRLLATAGARDYLRREVDVQ
jgi:hypothetical protein